MLDSRKGGVMADRIDNVAERVQVVEVKVDHLTERVQVVEGKVDQLSSSVDARCQPQSATRGQ